MRYNKWHLWLGVAIGIVSPIFTFFIIYFSKFDHAGWLDIIFDRANHNIIRPFVQLSVLSNLALFFVFIMFNLDRISRGVLLSTILYGIYVLYITYY